MLNKLKGEFEKLLLIHYVINIIAFALFSIKKISSAYCFEFQRTYHWVVLHILIKISS